MPLFIYILKSKSVDKFYTGTSENPMRRLEYHNTIEKGFTARYRPWEIAFSHKFKSKKEALATERKIKSWKSSKMIQRVIDGDILL